MAQGKRSSPSILKNRRNVENVGMRKEISGFTAVVQAIFRDSTQLNDVIVELSRMKEMKKVLTQ